MVYLIKRRVTDNPLIGLAESRGYKALTTFLAVFGPTPFD